MSRITDAFKAGKAFIPFITCGDPSLEVTRDIIIALADAGATVIELGIPFSDPTAEGPVIQSASERALRAGVTTDKIFDMVATLNVSVPLVVMTYANVLFSYGLDRFAKRASEVGICGVILPDVPIEERDEFAPICNTYGIDFISLIAPNSRERTKLIASTAQGFIYCVSSLGVTGERASFEKGLADMIADIKSVTNVPCAIGFGISNAEQAKQMASLADGVIIGSTIVKLIASSKQEEIPEKVGKFASEIIRAIK